MSSISFVRVDTQEVIGHAPLVDWLLVVGELQGKIDSIDDDVLIRAKLMALMSFGTDFRLPPCRLLLTELDLVYLYWACSSVMIRIMKQVEQDAATLLKHPEPDCVDMTKLWAYKTSTVFVEMQALNMALVEARCDIEVREIRTPLLKVV